MDMNTMINMDCDYLNAVCSCSDDDFISIVKQFADFGLPRATYDLAVYYQHIGDENESKRCFDLLDSMLFEGVLPIRSVKYDGSHLMIINPDAMMINKILDPPRERRLASQTGDYEGHRFFSEFDAAALFFNLLDHKDPMILYQVALLYYYGYGVGKSYQKAFEFALKSAELGYTDAFSFVASCFRNGIGTTVSLVDVFKWTALAAESGDPYAQFNLSLMYRNGEGVPQSFSKMIYWLEKSAESHFVLALVNLGIAYQYGHGVDQSYQKAAQLFLNAVDLGSDEALYRIGVLFSKGLGIEQDSDKSQEAFYNSVPRLVDKKDEGDSDIEFLIGHIYENGNGVDQSLEYAIEMYRSAFSHGSYEAQLALQRLNIS